MKKINLTWLILFYFNPISATMPVVDGANLSQQIQNLAERAKQFEEEKQRWMDTLNFREKQKKLWDDIESTKKTLNNQLKQIDSIFKNNEKGKDLFSSFADFDLNQMVASGKGLYQLSEDVRQRLQKHKDLINYFDRCQLMLKLGFSKNEIDVCQKEVLSLVTAKTQLELFEEASAKLNKDFEDSKKRVGNSKDKKELISTINEQHTKEAEVLKTKVDLEIKKRQLDQLIQEEQKKQLERQNLSNAKIRF